MDKTSGEEREFLLGPTIDLKSCGTLAWNQSVIRQESHSEDWSYVCCLRTKDSECAEKHR
ncbi:hypothetical protein [Pseudomonas sp. Hp2]|uniref:hypothetical protein n=1 Tax=Pseudomonas sp. Hp2 TaxID=701189 RepID=UPI00112D80E9|nr:hypothetical protein [Pseudomonas sp. Hp2]